MSKILAVCLDDGHGMETAGKRSPITGMRENEFNRAVVGHLKELCKFNEILYLEVAPTDADTPLSVRTTSANKWNDELAKKYGNELSCVYVSVHANAGGGTGVEAWVHSNANTTTVTLGANIAAELAKLGLKNRGVKKGYPSAPSSNFAVNRDTDMTSVLIEHAFMDIKTDAALLESDKFRKDCAVADITAIMAHYGMGKPKQPPKASVLYKTQTGAFSVKEYADGEIKRLKAAGFKNAFIKAE